MWCKDKRYQDVLGEVYDRGARPTQIICLFVWWVRVEHWSIVFDKMRVGWKGSSHILDTSYIFRANLLVVFHGPLMKSLQGNNTSKISCGTSSLLAFWGCSVAITEIYVEFYKFKVIQFDCSDWTAPTLRCAWAEVSALGFKFKPPADSNKRFRGGL